MARINLLPWREELRKERRIRFFTIIGIACLVTLAVVGAVHLYFEQLISYQNSRNQFLQGQISLLNKKIKEIRDLEKERDRLLSRMRAIEKLQTSRPIIVHLFDALVDALPDGVYLKDLQQKGGLLTIKGVAQSNARVSSFMRNLDNSKWLTNPILDVIETGTSKEGTRLSNFTLRVSQAKLKGKGDEEDAQ